MFEFNGVFINPFEIASARIETQMGRVYLTLTLSSGDVFTEIFDSREEAMEIVSEVSAIVNPADLYDTDDNEDWL